VLPGPNGHGGYFLDSGWPYSFHRTRSQVTELKAEHLPDCPEGSWVQPLKPEPPNPDPRYPHPLDLLEEDLGLELDGFLGADFFWKVGCFTVSPGQRTLVLDAKKNFDVELVVTRSSSRRDNRPHAKIRWECKERNCLVDTGSITSFSSLLRRPDQYFDARRD
jgi:hypothetical protein